MACSFWPTKLGSGGPALTWIATGFGCGHDSPAAGGGAATVPASADDEATLRTEPTVSPALRSACSASASCWPLMSGTLIVFGPADGTSGTVEFFRTFGPIAGSGRRMDPALTVLLLTAVVPRTVNPSARSSWTAALSVRPATDGTLAWSMVNHQPPTPAAASTTAASAPHNATRRRGRGSAGWCSPGGSCPGAPGQPCSAAVLGQPVPLSTWVLFGPIRGCICWPYPAQSFTEIATRAVAWPGRPLGARSGARGPARPPAGEPPPARRDGGGTTSLTCL